MGWMLAAQASERNDFARTRADGLAGPDK